MTSCVLAKTDSAPLATNVEYRQYPSSQDPSLKLYAKFYKPKTKSGWIMVYMHGWHGEIVTPNTDNVKFPAQEVGALLIEPEMRGRGYSTGNPDCSGWELQDVVDAVEFARKEYKDLIAEPEKVELQGGSGGGGNAYGLLGKFPDFFFIAEIQAGMSDYALFFEMDKSGEFRDEMQGPSPIARWKKPWIGGNPTLLTEAYESRGGLTTVRNLLTPTLIYHGDCDVRLPVIHARAWVGAANGIGKGNLVEYHEFRDVGDDKDHFANQSPEQKEVYDQVFRRFRNKPREIVTIPDKGDFVVGGYLKTRKFEVIFDSIDSVGRVKYDLPKNEFKVSARSAREATLRIHKSDGSWEQKRVKCEPLGMSAAK